MASYVEFSETVNKADTLSAYRNLLKNIHYCVNLFEDLETGRTYWESITDWTVGERKSINVVKMKEQLTKLKKEIESGYESYTNLFAKMRCAQMIEQTYQQRFGGMKQSCNDNYCSDFQNLIESDYALLSKPVSEIQNTGLFQQKAICSGSVSSGVVATLTFESLLAGANIGIHGELLAIFTGLTPCGLVFATSVVGHTSAKIIGIISKMAYYYVKSQGKERGYKYQEAKFLSEALNNNEILSLFQSHHTSIGNLSMSIDTTLDMWKKYSEPTVQSPQKMNIGTNALQDAIKAKGIYDDAFQENLLSLQESEPDMSEATRNRMATKLAEAVCKTFLRKSLNYSEKDVDEFIQAFKH